MEETHIRGTDNPGQTESVRAGQTERVHAGHRERRELRAVSSPFNVREDGGARYLEGYFAVFNSDYEIWDGMTESIAPGAFAGTISGDVRALVNHDSTLVLGRTRAGTLELKEDSRGLWGRVAINDGDSAATDLYARVKRGDVGGCSIGFSILREEHSTDGASDHWTIQEADLFEVSVCTFPAYTETNIAARCRDRDTIRERTAAAWKSRMKARLHHGAESADASKAG